MAATVNTEIAAACRNEELPGCTCTSSGTNGRDENEDFITYDCAHDTVQSADITKTFLGLDYNVEIQDKHLTRDHNINAGLEVSLLLVFNHLNLVFR